MRRDDFHGLKSCYPCRAQVRPVRPSLLWKVAGVAGYVLCITMILAIGSMGLFMWLFPQVLLFIAAAGIIPPLHARAFAGPSCPRCGRPLPEPAKQPRPAAASKAAAAAPAVLQGRAAS